MINNFERLRSIKIPNRWRTVITAYWMILPALILYLLFVIYPIVRGFWVSLHRWDGLSEMTWLGIKNYEFVLDDEIFWEALGHTFIFAIVVTIVKNIFGLLLAILLNQKIKGQTFFRGATFMPVTFSFVVIGVLWSWIFNPTFGLLNFLLESTGLDFLIQGWLSDPDIALISVMWVDVWKWTGFHMVLFLAGIQGIEKELYEAASIDGASSTQSFFRITLPLLSQVTAVSVFMSLLGAFVSNYDVVYVMTGGGPYHSTEVAMTWIVSTTFRYARVGKANAMSMILFVFVAIFGFFQFILMTRRAHENR